MPCPPFWLALSQRLSWNSATSIGKRSPYSPDALAWLLQDLVLPQSHNRKPEARQYLSVGPVPSSVLENVRYPVVRVVALAKPLFEHPPISAVPEVAVAKDDDFRADEKVRISREPWVHLVREGRFLQSLHHREVKARVAALDLAHDLAALSNGESVPPSPQGFWISGGRPGPFQLWLLLHSLV